MFKISQLLEYSFVHIIAQHRSGSTALHEYVGASWDGKPRDKHRDQEGIGWWYETSGETQYHLGEPFNDFENYYPETRNKPGFLAWQQAQAQALCRDIKQHTQNYVSMKNLIDDIMKFDEETQDMLFDLPGITVGLYREDTFAQTCSECVLEIMADAFPDQSKGKVKQDQYTSLDRATFEEGLDGNIKQKQLMHSLKHRFDVMIAYEEIESQFPKTLAWQKNPPHSHTIINYDKVVAWYNQYMDSAGLIKKVTHKGINFIIDKTMQHKA